MILTGFELTLYPRLPLELTVFLLPPPECWDYKLVPGCLCSDAFLGHIPPFPTWGLLVHLLRNAAHGLED